MVKKVFTVQEDMAVEDVSKIFTKHPFRYIPVTKKGVIVGVISKREVINRLLRQYY
ncbi:MAG: CBS domain-containing protein [Deltaproteobacteria bacterium]|nr:CBS domain-containing protein [Deltaproteobacteria bacterium]